MSNRPDKTVHALAQIAERGSRRSPVFRWLWANRLAVSAALSAAERPDWPAIALSLADVGIVDGHGKRPSAHQTMTHWHVVRDRMAKERVKVPASASSDQSPAQLGVRFLDDPNKPKSDAEFTFRRAMPKPFEQG